jgi:hypothetical protein
MLKQLQEELQLAELELQQMRKTREIPGNRIQIEEPLLKRFKRDEQSTGESC